MLVFSPCFCFFFNQKKHQVTWATCNTGHLWYIFSSCTNGHKRELLCQSCSLTLIQLLQFDTNAVKSLLIFLSTDTQLTGFTAHINGSIVKRSCPSFSRSALCGRFQSPQLILCVSSASGEVQINTVEVSVGSSFCTQTNKTMSYRWNFVPETLLLPTEEKNHQWDLCNMSLVSLWQQSD